MDCRLQRLGHESAESFHDRLKRLYRCESPDTIPSPRSAAADSRSIKTTPQGGVKGFDNGKKVKGRKRHIWVDSLGRLLAG